MKTAVEDWFFMGLRASEWRTWRALAGDGNSEVGETLINQKSLVNILSEAMTWANVF